MSFGSRLKEARLAAELSQKELGALIGVTGNSVSNYENGTSSPNDAILLRMFDALSVEPNFLFQDSFSFQTEKNPAHAAFVSINVYGRIPAGIPMEAVEDIVDTEEIPASWTKGNKEYFALIVKGDSMYPEYLDGDTVIVRKQDTCENGDDCVVFVNGNDATLKRVFIQGDEQVTLRPINTNYAPVTYSRSSADLEEGLRIAGVVVELRRKK